MKNRIKPLFALLLVLPSLGWCVMLTRYGAEHTLPAWAAFAGIILHALVGGIIWQTSLRPSVADEVVHMPLFSLLCLLNERDDIRKVVINELEGTDYHEEPEENA